MVPELALGEVVARYEPDGNWWVLPPQRKVRARAITARLGAAISIQHDLNVVRALIVERCPEQVRPGHIRRRAEIELIQQARRIELELIPREARAR